jgi:hypothetical protein
MRVFLLLLAVCVGVADSFLSAPVRNAPSPTPTRREGLLCMRQDDGAVPSHLQGRRTGGPLPLSLRPDAQAADISRRQALAVPLTGLLWGALGVPDAKAINFTKITDGDGVYSTPGLWVVSPAPHKPARAPGCARRVELPHGGRSDPWASECGRAARDKRLAPCACVVFSAVRSQRRTASGRGCTTLTQWRGGS